jgi:hypothetical protein
MIRRQCATWLGQSTLSTWQTVIAFYKLAHTCAIAYNRRKQSQSLAKYLRKVDIVSSFLNMFGALRRNQVESAEYELQLECWSAIWTSRDTKLVYQQTRNFRISLDDNMEP